MPNITTTPPQPPSGAIWDKPADPATLKNLLTSPSTLSRIAKVAAKHLTPERLMNVSLSVINSPSKGSMRLLDCTPASLLQAVIHLAEVGLEPGGALQHAYLIPYRDKKNNRILARPSVSYMGYIELARRSGLLAQVEARIVHERDKFTLRYGLQQELDHVPYFGADDPGPALLVYSIARFKDGGFHVDTMSAAEVEKIRLRSQSKDDGPWRTDPEEMWKKTIIRRARKYWPQSPEMAKAAEIDDEDESNANVATARPFQVITDRAIEKDLNLKRVDAAAVEPPEPQAEPEDAAIENERLALPEGDDPYSILLRGILTAKDSNALDERLVEASRERKSMDEGDWEIVQRAISQRKSELQ